jgi:hypothetical protein
MVTGLRAVASFLFTLLLLLGSLGLFHQTHKYAEVLAPQPQRLSFLAVVCPVLSILTYVSPVGSVIQILKSGDATHFPIQVVIAQMLQNIAGAAYGILISNEPYLISSAVGLVVQTIWMICWFSVVRRSTRSRFVSTIHPFLATIGMGAFIALSAFALTLFGRDLVGTVSCGLTLLLSISPFAKLGLVVRSMNSASIPFIMSLVMLVTNIAWGIYGLMLEDVNVFLPALLGFLITVFQILVSAWCSGFLFYDLTFLKWLYTGYEPVGGNGHSPGVEMRVDSFGLSEENPH